MISDETGTGALVFAGGNIGAATATTPTAGDNSTKVATTAFVAGANAATATKLATARNIAGHAFDGSANISISCADLSDDAASCATDTTNASNISSGTLNTARLPSPYTSGTRSGNTSKFVTTTGTTTGGNCAKWDSDGNVVDAGAACGTGGGSTTDATPKAVVKLSSMTSANPTVTTIASTIGTITCSRSSEGNFTVSWQTGLSVRAYSITLIRSVASALAVTSDSSTSVSVNTRSISNTPTDMEGVYLMIYGSV